jgi:putative ABC transport system permease protein
VKALDRKLLRDLRLMWSQALTIALVVASGVGGFITTISAVDSLALARDRYYADGRFADVFAVIKRAPDALADELRALPGVAGVQTTVEHAVRIEIEGLSDPIIGQLIGVDPRRPASMNRVSLSAGRPLAETGRAGGSNADGTINALVSKGFASARGLQPGARLTALINGKRRTLQVTGIALSPEFIFAGFGGMPDTRGFGIFWVDEEVLSAAYDMEGAFNHIALKLAPGASEPAVIADLGRLIQPYGGREAYGREDQMSDKMLRQEIKEMHVLGTVLPSIFLAVAAFLLNVVISRVVATQREQIAALKALGYANRAIGAHYLKLVMIIVLTGLPLGILLGKWLGVGIAGLYAEFFFFPSFEHRIAPWLVLTGCGITLGTAVLGTLNAIAVTARMSPAEAMRPPAPAHYRRTLAERLGLGGLPTSLRMILRSMERKPLRAAISVGGVAAAVAIVIMGSFFRDAIEAIVDSKFNLEMRNDVVLWVAEPVTDAARFEIARLPGAASVESGRDAAVRLINGHRSERGMIQGVTERPELRRILDVDKRQHLPRTDGLLLTDRLADKLKLSAGDTVRVEMLEGKPRTLNVPVTGTVSDTMGLNVFMERRALNRLLGEDDVSTQFAVAVERGRETDFLAAAMALPRVAGAFSKATLLRNMQEISARNIRVMSTILTLFAAVIAVGVVYNNARIALAERAWELASMRVIGFTRAEVSWLLLGEMAICIAIALPLGMWLGHGLVNLIVELLKTDQFLFPIVILPRTYAWAGLIVLVAGMASALVVRRRIDRLDIIGALKTRE